MCKAKLGEKTDEAEVQSTRERLVGDGAGEAGCWPVMEGHLCRSWDFILRVK